jgi:hypothetical protein
MAIIAKRLDETYQEYRDRAITVLTRLVDEGFKNIERTESNKKKR